MRYTKVEGLEKPVSRIALGTMIVNTRELERSFRLLDDALELGVNTLDSAWVYAGGDSERGIGRWMQERKNRDQVVVLTKGCHPNSDRKTVTPFDIQAQLHDSLARLRADYIDIYLLHRDNPDVPVGPIVEVLNDLRREGKVRAFGGSNWTEARIKEANQYAAGKGLMGFTATSPNYSLAEQVQDPWGPGCSTIGGPAHEKDRQWYRENQMAIFAYSSLARGFLSGRITRENFEEQKANLDDACRTAYCHEVNFKRLDRAQKLAQKKGLSVPQVSLAFILSQGLNVIPLVGAETRDEIQSAVTASDIELTPEESAWLDLRAERA
ncbi:MAG TPA: aldo/keto reductase [Polyangiaceae bacterium]